MDTRLIPLFFIVALLSNERKNYALLPLMPMTMIGRRNANTVTHTSEVTRQYERYSGSPCRLLACLPCCRLQPGALFISQTLVQPRDQERSMLHRPIQSPAPKFSARPRDLFPQHVHVAACDPLIPSHFLPIGSLISATYSLQALFSAGSMDPIPMQASLKKRHYTSRRR